MYNWHPLYKYFIQALDYYDELYNSIGKTIDNFNNNEKDFNFILKFLNDCYDGEYENDKIGDIELLIVLQVFEPLIINCDKTLVLFKYDSFIALDKMGFGTEFWDIKNGLYQECRSVVMDIDSREIVLAPQAKFFNVNEREKWSENNIKNKIKEAFLVEITNKLDGSNQNYRFYNGKIIGSGSSAIDVSLSWRLQKGYELLKDNYQNMLKEYPDCTFMFEFLSPENQIVVHYDKTQEGLYLFGIRNSKTGYQYSYADTLLIAKKYNVLTTEIYNDSFEDILNQLDNYKAFEKEGWVISIRSKDDSVFKAKLKINDYVLIHSAISQLISPNSIIKAISDGCWDDFFAKIPEGHKEKAEIIKKQVVEYINLMDDKVNNYYNEAKYILKDNFNQRKDFMLWVKDNVKKPYSGYVISKYLGRKNNYLTKGNIGYKKLNELIINN